MRAGRLITAVALSAVIVSCGAGKSNAGAGDDTSRVSGNEMSAHIPEFSADSAFLYVKRQVGFGPRVPGTQSHARTADWLCGELRRHGAEVREQKADLKAYDGTVLKCRNIFGSFNPDKKDRLLLLAHYDTRPWADKDPDPANHAKPIDGANDGASGVAVLLEVARNLGIERPTIGVDILLTDCEDYGVREGSDVSDSGDSWCLGTQRFVRDMPYTASTIPRYGILLDMVGGRDARFNREYFSVSSAQLPTARVWDMARKLGLADAFPMAVGGAITDDHLPLIRAGIPTTDIIENASPSTGSFNPTWHTLADNIDNIDPASLAAAGRVTLNVVYNEKP